jgi:hypothetical protein
LGEIVAYFAERGLAPRVHTEAPPTPTAEELRRLSSALRHGPPAHAHWVDLSPTIRWYGGGDTEEDAIRAAAQRWRIEQVGTDNARRPGDPIP